VTVPGKVKGARSREIAPGQWVTATARGPVGYCAADVHAPHASADEAEACWRKYLIEQTLRLDGGGCSGTCMHPDGCTEYLEDAGKTVVINGYPRGVWCDEHRTAGNVTAWWNRPRGPAAP
jgi:hypothetical protein